MSPAFIALQGIKERAGRQIPVRTQEITAAAECNLLGRLHIVGLQEKFGVEAVLLKEAVLDELSAKEEEYLTRISVNCK